MAAKAQKKALTSTEALLPAIPPEQVRASMSSQLIGNRRYPVKISPTCAVCQHPGRQQVEEKLLNGWGYTAISRWVSDLDRVEVDGEIQQWPPMSPAAITAHFKNGHCPVDAYMVANLHEQRYGQLDYEQMANRIVDGVVLAQRVVARAEERLTAGEIEPTMKEGLAAAKLVAEVQAAAQETRTQDQMWALRRAFAVYFDLARSIMSDEQWTQFSLELHRSAELQQLVAQMRGDQPEDDIQDAQVVEDPA